MSFRRALLLNVQCGASVASMCIFSAILLMSVVSVVSVVSLGVCIVSMLVCVRVHCVSRVRTWCLKCPVPCVSVDHQQ